MRILSWNVNGIRAVVRKGFLPWLAEESPDILCLQESRTPTGWVFLEGLNGYQQFWNCAEKPGYSGTGILSKVKPVKISLGMEIAKHEKEGRVITGEFADFFLVDVYVPNSKRTLDRLPYRTKEWDVDLLKYVKKLEKKKPVVLCGDMNVAHQEIDLTYPKENIGNHGFTPQERAGFQRMIDA